MSDPVNPNTKPEEPVAPPPTPESAPPPPAEASAAGVPTVGPEASVGSRVVAALIDGLIGGVISLVPVIGWIVSIAYLITRDALPFLDGQSIGKKALNLRAVDAATLAPLTNNWGSSAVRNVVLFIPFFAIVELVVLISNKSQRLGDQWAKTKVVQVS